MIPAAKHAAREYGDYLPVNLVIAGIHLFSYQADLNTETFHTSELLTPASVATRNEALVRPNGSIFVTTEKEFWTLYIPSSSPLEEDGLKLGSLVLVMIDIGPCKWEDSARCMLMAPASMPDNEPEETDYNCHKSSRDFSGYQLDYTHHEPARLSTAPV